METSLGRKNGKWYHEMETEPVIRYIERFTQEQSEVNSLDQIKNLDKDVFIMVYADWCGYCRQAKPDFNNLSTNKDVKIVLVNADKAPELTRQIGSNGFPHFAYYHKDSGKFETAAVPRNINAWTSFIDSKN